MCLWVCTCVSLFIGGFAHFYSWLEDRTLQATETRGRETKPSMGRGVTASGASVLSINVPLFSSAAPIRTQCMKRKSIIEKEVLRKPVIKQRLWGRRCLPSTDPLCRLLCSLSDGAYSSGLWVCGVMGSGHSWLPSRTVPGLGHSHRCLSNAWTPRSTMLHQDL